jgi:hypothetical protein
MVGCPASGLSVEPEVCFGLRYIDHGIDKPCFTGGEQVARMVRVQVREQHTVDPVQGYNLKP